ncbi:MAG TPA: Fe-S protein assembly co-chaperone HscB [Alphaproteobacteria bacterium]|nr:Fe-S protein assembly co-chaperone HscB [Alphaproteobacteria bacterium]
MVAESLSMFENKVNPFDIFELEPSYELNLQELDKRYFALQEQVHPDKLAKTDSFTKLQAQLLSGAFNEAYEILKHPLHRAKAYLEVLGVDLPDQETFNASDDLLMDIMALQEKLKTLEAPKDIRDFETEITLKFKEALSNLFEKKDVKFWIQAIYYWKILTLVFERLKALSTFHCV